MCLCFIMRYEAFSGVDAQMAPDRGEQSNYGGGDFAVPLGGADGLRGERVGHILYLFLGNEIYGDNGVHRNVIAGGVEFKLRRDDEGQKGSFLWWLLGQLWLTGGEICFDAI